MQNLTVSQRILCGHGLTTSYKHTAPSAGPTSLWSHFNPRLLPKTSSIDMSCELNVEGTSAKNVAAVIVVGEPGLDKRKTNQNLTWQQLLDFNIKKINK